MIKKLAIFFILLVLLLSIVGCETSKGLVQGTAVGIYATAEGVSEGAVKDSKNLWSALVGADNWMKKNLW